MTDKLKQSLELAKQIAREEYFIREEKLFSFRNEVDCSNFISDIYHPEHHACMINPFKSKKLFLSGTSMPFKGDIEAIYRLISIYSEMAERYDGKFYSFRFRIWRGSIEAYKDKYGDWVSLTSFKFYF